MEHQPIEDDYLNQVMAQFAAWREQRGHARQAFPAELWEAAGKLLQSRPLTHVAKALGVSPSALKQKAGEGMASGRTYRDEDRPFVRTRVQDLFSSSPGLNGVWRLVFERPDGGQLKVSLPMREKETLRFLGKRSMNPIFY